MHFEGCPGVMDDEHSNFGLVGGVLMMIGGVVGACLKRWVSLLPGTIVFLIAWASVYSVIWICVGIGLLLLLYCIIPQAAIQDKVTHRNPIENFESDACIYSEMEYKQPYQDVSIL
jgi:hypothetical protein